MAVVARIRGRRIRRRRQTVLGAAVVLLAGAVITPYVVLDERRDGQRPLPVASVPPSKSPADPLPSGPVTMPAIRTDWWQAPIELPGGVVVTSVSRPNTYNDDGTPTFTGATPQDGNVALNRVTGRYQVFPVKYQVFTAAPQGHYVLVEDESMAGGYVPVGIVDAVDNGAKVLTHGSGLGTEWSPDGEKVALTTMLGNLRIIDAKSVTETERKIPGGRELCPDVCAFTWLPGGKEVALPQRDPDVAQSESVRDTIKEIKVFSATTGKLLRTLPIPGVPAGSAAWSPDGRYVALRPDATASVGTRIAEVATGRVVTTLPWAGQVRFLAGDQVLALNGLDVTVYDLTGAVRATSRLPADFANREVSLGVG